MKNINLMTLMWFLIVPVLSLTSNVVLAEKSIVDTSINTPLSYDDEFLKAGQAFRIGFAQQGNTLTVHFDIAPGYYLYRQQFKFQSKNLALSPIELPVGIIHEDAYFGVQQIYKEKLSFTINIEKSSADANVAVTYQGCAEKGLCYPPTTQIVMIDHVKANNTSENIK